MKRWLCAFCMQPKRIFQSANDHNFFLGQPVLKFSGKASKEEKLEMSKYTPIFGHANQSDPISARLQRKHLLVKDDT